MSIFYHTNEKIGIMWIYYREVPVTGRAGLSAVENYPHQVGGRQEASRESLIIQQILWNK